MTFDTSTGRRLTLVSGERYTAVAMSGDGSVSAAARDARVSVWRAGAEERVDLDVGRAALSLAVARDGRRVAVGTADGVEIWSVGGDRLASVGGPRAATSVAFSPAADLVAAGHANGSVGVWRVRDGRRLFQRLHHRRGARVLSVAFSSGGGRVVTAGSDAEAFVMNARNGRLLQALRGHSASISAAAFSPDGRWLVTAGPGKAGLWDLVRGQRLSFLDGHEGRLLAASFDAAGRRVVTVGRDGTLRAYACDTCGGIAELRRLAERRLEATGRKLTPAERQRYLGGD
jgi:WD40 repeat protein